MMALTKPMNQPSVVKPGGGSLTRPEGEGPVPGEAEPQALPPGSWPCVRASLLSQPLCPQGMGRGSSRPGPQTPEDQVGAEGPTAPSL